MRRLRRVAILAFTMVLAFVLVACGGSASSTDGSAAGSQSASTASETKAKGLVGKPWITSVLAGNLPIEQPEAKDDLYMHYAYDYLADHQLTGGNAMEEHFNELRDATTALIKDESKKGHDLEQLRILYNQAADTEKLNATGLSEVQPYLDRIDATTSLAELNAVLVANDFPFSPFISAQVKPSDTRSTNAVSLNPNFLLCNADIVGGTYYQDTDDQMAQKAAEAQFALANAFTSADFESMGMDSESIQSALAKVTEFEKQHGKHLQSNSTYVKKDFGALAQDMRSDTFTLEELCSLCPNFPMRETLANLKKDQSERYTASRQWLEAFNGVWTEENFDAIKLMTKAKVLSETRPYRGTPVSKETSERIAKINESLGPAAYRACDNLNTLAQVLAKTYVDECLPAGTKERLAQLSQEVVNTYKDLVNNTKWISEESKQRVEEKLDHMTLNVLEPVDGYFDYSGLNLVPTDQGGTAFSNYLACKQYRYDCEAKLVGQPASKGCIWYGIAPTTGNAFYDVEDNSINVLPGYLTSLVYKDGMGIEELLSDVGLTIGHEISHGFDYQGAQVDAYGAPNPIFTEADVSKFLDKNAKLAEYYSGIELMPGVMADGKRLAAETCADLCGLQAVLEIAGKSENFDYVKFFNSMSNIWAQVIPEQLFAAHAADTHPLNYLRINVNAQMFDPIYSKLGVVEGNGMYLAPDKRIVVWGPNA